MDITFARVDAATAAAPLVLALDIGSTASRGALYDAHGRPVGARVKLSHAFEVGPDGASQIDADAVVAEVAAIIDALLRPDGPTRGRGVAGVALDAFASSFVMVDADGDALAPCITYADSRPRAHVEALRAQIVETDLHQRVGTRIHASYWPARLRWLRAERPDLARRAAHYLTLGDYVLWKLTGCLATGTSSAAWTGMVDLRTGDWSEEVLALAGVQRAALAPVHHLDQPLTVSPAGRRRITARWPGLAGARWFASIADGLAANVGLGASGPETIGGSAATSGALRVLVREPPATLPGGLWCYRVSRDRALVGGAINDVGRAIAWATSGLSSGRFRAALQSQPTAATPLVLPFFTGERSTGWAAHARAVFCGVDATTDGAALARGVVEGVAIGYRRILAQLREVAPEASALHIGGSVATRHPAVLQVLADVLELPLTPVTIKRSTLLGTALLALETLAPGAGRSRPAGGGAGARAGAGADTLEPVASRAAYYRERIGQFEEVYAALFG